MSEAEVSVLGEIKFYLNLIKLPSFLSLFKLSFVPPSWVKNERSGSFHIKSDPLWKSLHLLPASSYTTWLEEKNLIEDKNIITHI